MNNYVLAELDELTIKIKTKQAARRDCLYYFKLLSLLHLVVCRVLLNFMAETWTAGNSTIKLYMSVAHFILG